MTAGADDDKRPADGTRHVYGPRAVSALLPALVRPAFRKRNFAAAQVLADWEAIVGPARAAVATPRKLAGGTLSIGCSGPMAVELQHDSAMLISRINGYLGSVAVVRLRFVRGPPAPPASAASSPPPQALLAAKAAVAGLPDGPLRDALEKLGRVVLATARET